MIVITIAKKPSKKGITDCVLENGCGAINIAQTRVGTTGGRTNKGGYQDQFVGGTVSYDDGKGVESDHTPKGRWPANVLLSHLVCEALDEQSGVSTSSGGRIGNAEGIYSNQGRTGWGTGHTQGDPGFGDVGGASRYFMVFK